MPTTIISITHSLESSTWLTDRLYQDTSKPRLEARALADYLRALGGGARYGKFDVQIDSATPAAASGTITVASHGDLDAGDTITIAGVVLTAHAATQNSTTFAVGANATAAATNIKTCINANTTLNPVLVATSSTNVVTVTAKGKGAWGNLVTLAVSDATALTVAARLTSGAGATGTARTYLLGLT